MDLIGKVWAKAISYVHAQLYNGLCSNSLHILAALEFAGSGTF